MTDREFEFRAQRTEFSVASHDPNKCVYYCPHNCIRERKNILITIVKREGHLIQIQ